MKKLIVLLLLAAASLPSAVFAEDLVGDEFVNGHIMTNEDVDVYMEFSETVIKPGSKFRINVVLMNMTDVPLRILEPVLSKGEGLNFLREDGSQIQSKASEFAETNLDKGVFYGRTHLLKPHKRRVIKWVAFLDRNYILRFASEKLKKGSKPKKVRGIPSAFVSSGRVYHLEKPGIFTARLFFRVVDTRQQIIGPRGEVYSKEEMWFGNSPSNTIKFLVK